MPWSVADTVYDHGHPWDSLFNGPQESAMRQSPYTEKLMAQAAMLASPATPDQVIRDTMMQAPLYDWGTPRPQPTIDSVVSGEALQPPQANWSDFSGTAAGVEASARPTISVG
jgi:hypothetical protein